MKQFKGGESEWVDVKLGEEEGSDVRGGHREGPEGDLRRSCSEVEALLRTSDHLEDTYKCVKEMSGYIYNRLVKICSNEAFGTVRMVESGGGVEA